MVHEEFCNWFSSSVEYLSTNYFETAYEFPLHIELYDSRSISLYRLSSTRFFLGKRIIEFERQTSFDPIVEFVDNDCRSLVRNLWLCIWNSLLPANYLWTKGSLPLGWNSGVDACLEELIGAFKNLMHIKLYGVSKWLIKIIRIDYALWGLMKIWDAS